MPHETAADLLVLHAVRIRGFAEVDAIADMTGLRHGAVAEPLAGAADDGLAVHRDGRIAGWSLTPAGRDEHRRRLADDVARAARGEAIQGAYARFLQINERFKETCTAWQVEDRPARCIDDVRSIHYAADNIVGDLASAMARFSPYRHRLEAALARLVAGDGDALTKPLSGSYHDVWMELHQDLLLTLDRSRSTDDGS